MYNQYFTKSLHHIGTMENEEEDRRSPLLPRPFSMLGVKKIIAKQVGLKELDDEALQEADYIEVDNITVSFFTSNDDEKLEKGGEVSKQIANKLKGENGGIEFAVLLMDSMKTEKEPKNQEYHFVVFARCGNSVYLLDPLGINAKEKVEEEWRGKKEGEGKKEYYSHLGGVLLDIKENDNKNTQFFYMTQDIQKDEFNCGSYACEIVKGMSEKFKECQEQKKFNDYMQTFFCGNTLSIYTKKIDEEKVECISDSAIENSSEKLKIQTELRIEEGEKSIGVLPYELAKLAGSATYLGKLIQAFCRSEGIQQDSSAISSTSTTTGQNGEKEQSHSPIVSPVGVDTQPSKEIIFQERQGKLGMAVSEYETEYEKSEELKKEKERVASLLQANIENLQKLKKYREEHRCPFLPYIASEIYDNTRREQFKILLGEKRGEEIWLNEGEENKQKKEIIFGRRRSFSIR